jgi:type I restriction enzyme M protein
VRYESTRLCFEADVIEPLRDRDALEASANLPAPEVIAAEIVEDLRAALAEFEQLEAALSAAGGDAER